MNVLYVIPARGGSKGIPYKNIKELAGKPLIHYSIDVARSLTTDEDICLSSDDDLIIKTAEDYGLNVLFKRPDYLSTDRAGSYNVLLHAIQYYESIGRYYDLVVLLQPTSPFRQKKHIEEAISLWNRNIEMVVSVKEASSNPYYNCFEENNDGFLQISKGDGLFERRQDIPEAWEYNGSIYVIGVEALKRCNMSEFTKVKKYQMDDIFSVDIDTMFDWKVAELILCEHLINL